MKDIEQLGDGSQKARRRHSLSARRREYGEEVRSSVVQQPTACREQRTSLTTVEHGTMYDCTEMRRSELILSLGRLGLARSVNGSRQSLGEIGELDRTIVQLRLALLHDHDRRHRLDAEPVLDVDERVRVLDRVEIEVVVEVGRERLVERREVGRLGEEDDGGATGLGRRSDGLLDILARLQLGLRKSAEPRRRRTSLKVRGHVVRGIVGECASSALALVVPRLSRRSPIPDFDGREARTSSANESYPRLSRSTDAMLSAKPRHGVDSDAPLDPVFGAQRLVTVLVAVDCGEVDEALPS